MKKLKPKAYSMGIGGYSIIYKCGKDGCGYPFNMADNDWLYCPHCGTPIDWGVVTVANEEWKQEFLSIRDDEEKRNAMLSVLDVLNLGIKDGERRALKITESTKRAITASNIQYYLGIGWTKEELLSKGIFTKKDFE